jgi:acyl-CoA synthetase (AMP-forming)/AMP-acid ligase II
MTMSSIAQLINQQAALTPKAVYALDAEQDHCLDHADLQSSCAAIVGVFERQGLTAGDTVSVVMPNGLNTLRVLLGGIWGGYCVNPVNLLAQTDQMRYVLDHSDCKLVVVSPEWADKVQAMLKDIERPIQLLVAEPTLQPLPGEAALCESALDQALQQSHEQVTPQRAALLMYTSGTTGVPKGVVLTQAQLAHNAMSIAAEHQLTQNDRVLAVLPLYHINAFVVTMLTPLACGGSLALTARFSVGRFWAQVAATKCTWINLVPTMVSYLLEHDTPDTSITAGLRFCRSASASLPPEHLQGFEKKFGLGVIETMGLTETAAPAFSNPLQSSQRKLGSVGKASGCEARVVDPNMQPVPDGTTGEMVIRGGNVMLGYYKNPNATEQALTPDGWLRTGDLGHRDADGFFFVTGRIKELIIKGGENIAPREIDEVLLRHPGVLDAAAVGVPDPHYGQEILVCVIARDGHSVTDAILREHCIPLLGRFKTPKYFCVVQDLPRGPSGKVQRLKLPNLPECKVLLG